MNAEQKQIRKARGILDHANSCDSNKLALAGETTEWSSLNTFEVDIFALQIYGFIVCRGSVEDKAGELFDLPFVGSPLANCGGIVAAIQEVPGHVIILVLATVEEGQSSGSLDAFVLGHGVELFLVSSHLGRVAWVWSVASCGSVSALS